MDKAEAHFYPFGDSYNSVQERCTVCAECTTGLEIALGTPDSTPMYCMSTEACFGLYGDSVSLGAR
jgi:hypothetical protein